MTVEYGVRPLALGADIVARSCEVLENILSMFRSKFPGETNVTSAPASATRRGSSAKSRQSSTRSRCGRSGPRRACHSQPARASGPAPGATSKTLAGAVEATRRRGTPREAKRDLMAARLDSRYLSSEAAAPWKFLYFDHLGARSWPRFPGHDGSWMLSFTCRWFKNGYRAVAFRHPVSARRGQAH